VCAPVRTAVTVGGAGFAEDPEPPLNEAPHAKPAGGEGVGLGGEVVALWDGDGLGGGVLALGVDELEQATSNAPSTAGARTRIRRIATRFTFPIMPRPHEVCLAYASLVTRLRGFLLVVAFVAAACTSSAPPPVPPPPPQPSSPSVPPASPEPAPHWTPIAAAPIAGRISEGVVWTGSEMIVWGGVARTAQSAEQAGDGAAYDPANDSWEQLAPAPGGLKGGGQASAWTGSEAVFWVGNSPDGPVGGAVYDPVVGSWHKLPPGPLGVREGYVSVWTGSRLLIMGGVAGDQLATPIGAGVNPSTGSWRSLAGLNKLTGFLPTGAVWNGKEAFLFGNTSQCPELGAACQKYAPTFVSYTPGSDTVHEIGLQHVPIGRKQLGSLVATAWTENHVLFTTSLDPSAGPVLYDPAANSWHVGPRAPCEPTDPGYSQTAWAGSMLVVPCGRSHLALYDPAADSWRTISAGPSPLNSRSSSAIVWTGRQLIVWSGMPKRTGNPALQSGAIIDLSGIAGA
jgi:hypothetical protein